MGQAAASPRAQMLRAGHERVSEYATGKQAGIDSRVTLNLLGKLQEHVDLALRAATLDEAEEMSALGPWASNIAHDDCDPPRHHVGHPGRALTAGRALSTRLMLVKLGEPGDGLDHIRRFVHDDDGTRAEAGAKVLERVIVHKGDLAVGLGHDGDGAASRDDTLEVIPSAADATAVLLEELLERDRHFLLNDTGLVDMS